jgi:hypothetical protein
MTEKVWKLRQGVSLDADDVAKIACALKSLSVYTSMACDSDDNPEELKELVDEGLQAVDKIFET